MSSFHRYIGKYYDQKIAISAVLSDTFFFIFISIRKWCGMRFFFHTYPKHMYLLLLSVFDSITTEEKQQYSLNHSPLFNLGGFQILRKHLWGGGGFAKCLLFLMRGEGG